MSTHRPATAAADADGGAGPSGRELRRALTDRHISMIALGGAIGTGLFYGASDSVGIAGPAVLITYALGGLAIYLVMRALGEMAWHSPVTGAFSEYATRYWGRFPGFFSGWNYWFNYVFVSMAELSVVGLYVNYWWPQIPAWVSAAVCLIVITAVNLVDVRAFGEFEFVFASVKIVAIVAMIVLGLFLIVGVGPQAGTGLSNLWAHGGFAPNGAWGVLSALVVVMFAFGGVELVGITAGEAEEPRRTIPKAIDRVVYRILLFYIGALAVILALVPWNTLDEDHSPFVLIFDRLGVPYAAGILNVVVLTAALSAYNSGLYSNGRMLYSLAQRGDAPRSLGRLNRRGAPVAGVLVSSAVTAVAVVLVFALGSKVFALLVPVALMAGLFNWSMILVTHLLFRRHLGAAGVAELGYRMPLSPFTNVVALGFFVFVVAVMMTQESSRLTPLYGLVWLAVVALGYAVRDRLGQPRHDGSTRDA